MNKKRIIARIIVSPFIFGILTVTYTIGLLKHFVLYIKYGGEWITHGKDASVNMVDIFNELKKQHYEKP